MAQGLGDLIKSAQETVKALYAVQQALKAVFPNAATTATSATAGTNGDVPAQVAGYLNVVNPATGATVKVPFYNV